MQVCDGSLYSNHMVIGQLHGWPGSGETSVRISAKEGTAVFFQGFAKSRKTFPGNSWRVGIFVAEDFLLCTSLFAYHFFCIDGLVYIISFNEF